MLLTLDSSVFVAALRKGEPAHKECLRLLEQVADGRHVAVQPLSVLVEIGAAIRRRTASRELASRVVQDLLTFTALEFVELDLSRAQRALTVAYVTGVRGMDALVVAVAQEFGTSVVSLDAEMIARSAALVPTAAVNDVLLP